MPEFGDRDSHEMPAWLRYRVFAIAVPAMIATDNRHLGTAAFIPVLEHWIVLTFAAPMATSAARETERESCATTGLAIARIRLRIAPTTNTPSSHRTSLILASRGECSILYTNRMRA